MIQKKQRVCSTCEKPGHTAKTCPGIIPTGHQILIDSKKKAPREEINGIKPSKGLWIINRDKKKIAGQIDFIKRNGIIVWHSTASSALVESKPETFKNSGYEYIKDVPQEEGWFHLSIYHACPSDE